MEQPKKPTYKCCIVPECKNTITSAPDKVFFHVPRGMAIRKKWCKVIQRNMISPSTPFYCCEDHFNIEEDADNYMQYKIMTLQEKQKTRLQLKKGILPHKFQCQKDTAPQSQAQKKGSLKRKHQEIIDEAVIILPDNQSVNIQIITKSSLNNDLDIGCSSSPCEQSTEGNENENKNICEPVCRTPVCNVYDINLSSPQPSVLSSSFEPETSPDLCCKEDDTDQEIQFKKQMRSCMLTAVEKNPNMLLGVPKRSYYLIKLLSENIPLPTIDILITLKKIKLNESFSILALQFGYTQRKISRIFSKSIPLLSQKMKELIVRPTPTEISQNLPSIFRARYSNVVSIIDCLEIQIEKPLNKKKCNTLKYLISYTPDGLVNFVSVGYSDQATDLMIVEESGFLECLPANTAVMADATFKDISSLLQTKDCILEKLSSVFKPPRTKNIKQSKRIAALKIHIEQVVGRIRKFHMLQPHACVDHDLVPVMNDVIVVACGLINTQYVLLKK